MNKYLVTITLLLVFGTSAYMSIYGLTAVFTNMAAVIVCMGLGMELGKILSVIQLHRNWREIGWGARSFFVTVIIALTLVTSLEVLGFLTQRHAVATRGLTAIDVKILELNKEAEILHSHIAVVDQTLAGLPAGYVTKRFRERKAAGYEKMRDRLLEIVRETSELEGLKIANAAYSAPIFAAGRVFGLDPEKTISMFVLFLVAVLEPLSIGLAVAASSVWQVSGKMGQSAAETAQRTAKAADPYTIELKAIVELHNLKTKDIAEITDRKQLETVEGWLNGKPPIPIKALRLLRRWAAKQPGIRLMKFGGGHEHI